MKKTLCALLALLMLTAHAPAETYTAEDMFTMWYPDGWTRDEVSYAADNSDDYTWLADLYGSDYFASVFLELIDGYESFNLAQADEAETQKWLDDQFARFAGYSPTYVETLRTDDGALPFIVYTISDDGVPLLEAVTVVNGVHYCIDISMDDGSPLTDEAYDILRRMAASFQLAYAPESLQTPPPSQDAQDGAQETPEPARAERPAATAMVVEI